LCCSVIIVLFYVLIVCTVTLPPGVNPIAVDKCSYLNTLSGQTADFLVSVKSGVPYHYHYVFNGKSLETK